MIVYDLYYKATDGVVKVETYDSLAHLVRDFHNRIKFLPDFTVVLGHQERMLDLMPVPEHKPAYTMLFKP